MPWRSSASTHSNDSSPPRVCATVFVAMMINGLVITAGISGAYFFTVIIQGGSAGAFLSSFTALATLPDLWIAMIKAAVFGWLAAIVGAYKGLNAGGGPSGVGRSEEHTSELQSLMRISYAVFCLKKKKISKTKM